MKNIKLSLDKNKKYVVACSFGPDSMALLDAAIKNNLNVVVAHVNYRKRKAAQDEQRNLETFCKQHNIKCFVLDLLNQKPDGNFQDWARQKRYEFFKTIAIQEGADAVLVAHQQDDVIETYLMQKKRHNFVKNYGISEENELFGVKIIRPLLGYSKQELQQYDDENNIPYSIDESNLTDHYSRNKIRHSIVEKLSQKERTQILKEIEQAKNEKPIIKSIYSKDEFLNLSYESIVQILDHFLKLTKSHTDISRKYIDEIKKAFNSKTNHRFEIAKQLWLEIDYGDVYLINAEKIKPYSFEVTHKGNNEFIEIDFSNNGNDRGLNVSRFKVKNCEKNDKLIIKDYVSEIRRLFIDWKMPLFLREIWPGIYDEKGELIYVPRYRKNFKDEHESKFRIETDYFLKF